MGEEILKAKVCLVGQASVGKTSLIRRFVLNMYDEHYISTVGTRVSKKTVLVRPPGHDAELRVDMAIWDTMGQEDFRDIVAELSFAGVQGILAVADLTRRETLDALHDWIDRADRAEPGVPVLIALNKADLEARAAFRLEDVEPIAWARGGIVLPTSAKTGLNVERAFQWLAEEAARRALGIPADAGADGEVV